MTVGDQERTDDDRDDFFGAPSGSTLCELDSNPVAYCQTFQPQQSVGMDANGTLKICNDKPDGCVDNPDGELTLAYGQIASRGPFTCNSATAGIKRVG